MISYKVLIILTVISITGCINSLIDAELPGVIRKKIVICMICNSPVIMRAVSGRQSTCGIWWKQYDCNDALREAGFSGDYGFLSCCYAKQFESFQTFKNHVFKMTKSNEVQSIVKDFFMYFRKNQFCTKEKLMDPYMFCYKKMKKGFQIPCCTQTLDNDEIKNCEEKILKSDDCEEKILKSDDCEEKILKSDDEIEDINKYRKIIENIKYGKNKYQNVIKSYSLKVQETSNRDRIMQFWSGIKKEYYNYHAELLTKMSDYDKFSTTHKWCEKKIAEAIKEKKDAAEAETRAKKKADN